MLTTCRRWRLSILIQIWQRGRRPFSEKFRQRILWSFRNDKVIVLHIEICLHGFDFGLGVLLKDFEHGEIFRQLAQIAKIALDTIIS